MVKLHHVKESPRGDLLALAMYALAITPLIKMLHDNVPTTKQVWYANDATGIGSCEHLREWWEYISTEGPKYGHFPNCSKTYLVVKPGMESKAMSVFAGPHVNITSEGHHHLGAVIGSRGFCEEYVRTKVISWCEDLARLATVASCHPQAVYSVFTRSMMSH